MICYILFKIKKNKTKQNKILFKRKMCQECVIEVSPDRGNVTVESGFYPLNMKKCKNCQTFSTPKTTDYVNDEAEDSSSITITYNRNIF